MPKPHMYCREEVDIEKLKQILDRVPLSKEERDMFIKVLDSYLFFGQELEKKKTSINKLRKMLFGDQSEKTKVIRRKVLKAVEKNGNSLDGKDDKSRQKTKGHGRNGASAYTGAETVHIPHESLNPKDPCPNCENGKLYAYTPKVFVRLTGSAPVTGKVYEMDCLRCNLCGTIFSAPAPEGVSDEKYDADTASILAMLKYGAGMPFNRLSQLQSSVGIPLASSTQWGILKDASDKMVLPFNELVSQAAQGEVFHNDDTNMRIQELSAIGQPESQDKKADRTGIFTTGIVSLFDGHKIALYFTGRNHAGKISHKCSNNG